MDLKTETKRAKRVGRFLWKFTKGFVKAFVCIVKTVILTFQLAFSVGILIIGIILAHTFGLLPEWQTWGGVEDYGPVLFVDPAGLVLEQKTGGPTERFIRKLTGKEERAETSLFELIETIEDARDDPNIRALFLDFTRMHFIGRGESEELSRALATFQSAGKKVFAFSPDYRQWEYFVARASDKIYLSPLGGVMLRGFSRHRFYHREGLDTLGIIPHIFRSGPHKTYPNSFINREMPQEEKEDHRHHIRTLWAVFLDQTATGRGIEKDHLEAYANQYDTLLIAHEGDTDQLALDYGLVDGLYTRREAKRAIAEEIEEEYGDDLFIYWDEYKQEVGRETSTEHPFIAVIVMQGDIVYGSADPGLIGGASTAALIRKADREGAQAIVLRINSGGGSLLGSERVRRAVEDVEIPVVVTMGTHAASGAYWIATQADRILARPTTTTGSIGVGMFAFSAEAFLENFLGTTLDGVGTTWLSREGFALPSPLGLGSPPSERYEKMLQVMVHNSHQRFVTLVSETRSLTLEEVRSLAGGYVFTGSEAVEKGLVDALGGFRDALMDAGEMANLTTYEWRYYESAGEGLLEALLTDAKTLLTSLVQQDSPFSSSSIGDVWRRIERMDDPQGLYALYW